MPGVSLFDFVAACPVRGGAPRPSAGAAPAGAAAPLSTTEVLSRVTTTPSECAEGVDRPPGAPCASRGVLAAIVAFAEDLPAGAALPPDPPGPPGRPRGGRGRPPRRSPRLAAKKSGGLLPSGTTREAEAVRAAAAALGVESEARVLKHPSLLEFVTKRGLLPPKALSRELDLRFKAPGPRNDLSLLSNFHIDGTLQRWARAFPEFFPCPFAMIDFADNGDLFGEVDLVEVLRGEQPADLGPGVGRVRRPSPCFGCVVNTDTSRGPGKHWVATFVDCRAPPSAPADWTVEYFNSAGRPPDRAVTRWMEQQRARLAGHRAGAAPPAPPPAPPPGGVRSLVVTEVDHQESQTECGLYALYYIRSRLEGTPPEFFLENVVPDAAMTAFREHVFSLQ